MRRAREESYREYMRNYGATAGGFGTYGGYNQDPFRRRRTGFGLF